MEKLTNGNCKSIELWKGIFTTRERGNNNELSMALLRLKRIKDEDNHYNTKISWWRIQWLREIFVANSMEQLKVAKLQV